MKYILVGMGFGLLWAFIQGLRGTSEPLPLIGPVILCGAFGAVLWGLRILVLRFRGPKDR